MIIFNAIYTHTTILYIFFTYTLIANNNKKLLPIRYDLMWNVAEKSTEQNKSIQNNNNNTH